MSVRIWTHLLNDYPVHTPSNRELPMWRLYSEWMSVTPVQKHSIELYEYWGSYSAFEYSSSFLLDIPHIDGFYELCRYSISLKGSKQLLCRSGKYHALWDLSQMRFNIILQDLFRPNHFCGSLLIPFQGIHKPNSGSKTEERIHQPLFPVRN